MRIQRTLWFPVFAVTAIVAVAIPRSARSQAPAHWALSAIPVTSIGVVEGSTDDELANVSGARRLADGRVIVANGKPLELRVYSAAGKLVQRIGRSGDGPGEFRGRLDFLPAGGDSILIYDQASLRTILYSPGGKLLHEWPAKQGGSDRGMIVYRRALAPAIPPQMNHCFRQFASTLPLLDPPALRTVVADDNGHFWVRIDKDNALTAYSTNGRILGVVRLPPRFEVYRIDHGYFTGLTLTDDDVEEVQVFRLATVPASPVGACGTVADSFVRVKGVQVAPMITALRNAMTAGEMAYSNYGSYVSTIDSMPTLKAQLPKGMTFRMLRSGRKGWAAILFDQHSTLTCLFGLSDETPPGWADGTIGCSD